MKTSVLLATYNGAKYLKPLLNSLRTQEWKELTILYQDDGSSDETQRLLEEAAAEDKRLHQGSESGKHLGAKGNFLSLLKQDDADRTALCDQDDVWRPEKIRLCQEAMNKAELEFGQETPILIHTDASLMNENGETIADSFFRHQGWDPKATDLCRLIVQNNVTGCTILMNRALREIAADYFDPEYFYMHDWFIALTASIFGKVIFLDRPLVEYRQHETNEVGASRCSLPRRALSSFAAVEHARNRIQITYRQTERLLEIYSGRMPKDKEMILRLYLETEQMKKARRVYTVMKSGFRMQNPVTIAGQIFFG